MLSHKDIAKRRAYQSRYMRERRRKDPKWREAQNKYKRELSHQNRKWIAAVKEASGCKYCPEEEPCCLDFHHRDSNTKVASIGEMAQWSEKRIRAEIDKCNVLCSNCHRKLMEKRKR